MKLPFAAEQVCCKKTLLELEQGLDEEEVGVLALAGVTDEPAGEEVAVSDRDPVKDRPNGATCSSAKGGHLSGLVCSPQN